MGEPTRHKVVFLGEKPLALECLRTLRAQPNIDVLGVCSRKRMDVWWGRQVLLDFCEAEGVPLLRRETLRELEFDFLISVLYPFVIEGDIIARAGRLAVNLHEAPLPRWRGCNGYAHAILAGDEWYGSTLHVMAPELDAGPLIAVETLPILPHETTKELYQRTAELSADMFRRWLPRIVGGEIRPFEPPSGAESFLNARNSLDGLKILAPKLPMAECFRRVRALDFVPWTPAHTLRGGRKFYFWIGDAAGRRAEILQHVPRVPAGDTLGETPLPDAGVAVISGLPRPLAVAEEAVYRQLFEWRG